MRLSLAVIILAGLYAWRCASLQPAVPLPINHEAPRLTPKPKTVEKAKPVRNEPYRLLAMYEGTACPDKVLLDWGGDEIDGDSTQTINIYTWSQAAASKGWQVEPCGRVVVVPHWFLRRGERKVRAYFFQHGKVIGHVVRKVIVE